MHSSETSARSRERLNRAEAAANTAPSAAAVGDLSVRLAAVEATATAQLGAAAVASSALDQRVLRLEDAGGVAVLAADLDATVARHAALAAETTHAASATAAEIANLAQRMEGGQTRQRWHSPRRLDHVEYAADLLEAGDVGPSWPTSEAWPRGWPPSRRRPLRPHRRQQPDR